MRISSLSVVATLVFMVVANSVAAGVVDSPLPLLNGKKSKYVFTVPGVTADTGGLETVFLCTSLDKKKTIRVGIELFDWDSAGPLNDVTAGNGRESLSVGETATFETNSVAAFSEDETITPSEAVNQGSARIVSTSTKLACTALIVDAQNSPPTSMTNLQVIKKTSQKGD